MLARRLRRLAPGGPWWPYEDPFELAASALLTQRARWEGAQRAMDNLAAAGLLTPRALARAPRREVEACVRTAGFYRAKARALQEMAERVEDRFGGDMAALLALPTAQLRAELMGWRGVGDETADAILLFAAGRPAFVVDAYTVRLMRRFGALQPEAAPRYHEVASAWAAAGATTARDARDLHAAIVELSKSTCTKSPRCGACPLADACAQVLPPPEA